MVTYENNRIIHINPAFTRMTGYEMVDVVGKDATVLRSGWHDEAFYQDIGCRLLNEGCWQGEIWNLCKDGIVHAKWLSIHVIHHPDGSRAGYWHLQNQGAFVNTGDFVKKGQPIGLAGKTGYAFVPHLHFLVWKFNNGQWQQIPTRFSTQKGVLYLRAWKKYKQPVE